MTYFTAYLWLESSEIWSSSYLHLNVLSAPIYSMQEEGLKSCWYDKYLMNECTKVDDVWSFYFSVKSLSKTQLSKWVGTIIMLSYLTHWSPRLCLPDCILCLFLNSENEVYHWDYKEGYVTFTPSFTYSLICWHKTRTD